jgi:hypothetical protein
MTVSAAPIGVRNLPLAKDKNERSRPIKPLPTDRVSPLNQLKILRAWAAMSHCGTRAATVNEVAKAVEMAASTVAMTNPFFASIGLLQRLAVGTYAPSDDVIAFFNARDAAFAPRKLAPVFRQAWFGQILIPRLTYAPMEEQAAISLLEEAASAGPESRKALGVTLDLMAAAQVIEREAGQLRLVPEFAGSGSPQSAPVIAVDQRIGDTQFHLNIHVDAKDLVTWTPEQIAAFFDGLTRLFPAKTER